MREMETTSEKDGTRIWEIRLKTDGEITELGVEHRSRMSVELEMKKSTLDMSVPVDHPRHYGHSRAAGCECETQERVGGGTEGWQSPPHRLVTSMAVDGDCLV